MTRERWAAIGPGARHHDVTSLLGPTERFLSHGGAESTGNRHNSTMRVLVVEDEEHLAAAIADGLTAEGFDVDVSHDGNDGLWRAREGSYDAIVLDVLLPGIHGYRVCRTLRDEGVWTPILILTAKDGEYDEAEALDTGADDFLSKPFSFVVLLARIRALIRRGAPPRPNVMHVGTLELCLLYTSPSPRDRQKSRMPSSA